MVTAACRISLMPRKKKKSTEFRMQSRGAAGLLAALS
jgi:hypothetical protein